MSDDLTGLYYLRARYYNPTTGRFTQEDVIYNDGLNLYAYCNSNPVMYCDPSGLAKIDCKKKTGGESGSPSRIIPGEDGIVTGGDSTKLGKNMMEAMGQKRSTKWTGYQAQHIIPAEMAEHQVVRKIGMDLDDATNGIFLRVPSDDVSAMSRHRGYHSVYSDYVKEQLDSIDIKQNTFVLQQQVLDLQNKLRYLQQSGLPLYGGKGQGATMDLWKRSMNRLQ